MIGGRVGAGDSEQVHLAAECGEISRNIGAAAGRVGFVSEVDHRDRCFRRNAAGLADDKVIEHHIADDDQALAGERGANFLEAGRGKVHRQGILSGRGMGGGNTLQEGGGAEVGQKGEETNLGARLFEDGALGRIEGIEGVVAGFGVEVGA